MTVEEIAHELARVTVYFEGISSDTSHTRSITLGNVQLSPRTPSLSKDAIRGQNEPRHVPATDGCHSQTMPRSERDS